MKYFVISVGILLSACTQTSIQPLSQTSFKVDTTAAPACGPVGAREVAFETAAIEVINRGYDRFIVSSDQGGPGQTSVTWNPHFGMQTHTSNRQNMVISMLDPSDTEYTNGLSAKEILGENWASVVAAGPRTTCTERTN